MDFENEDIAKYRKKTKSNTSKSKAKSNHKHTITECLFICENKPMLGSYCTICGKIHNMTLPTENVDGKHRMLTAEEIYKKYSELEQITVDNLWCKFVPITVNGD